MAEINWHNLLEVIDHAKSLGVGWVVYKDTGRNSIEPYGVCRKEDLEHQPRGLEFMKFKPGVYYTSTAVPKTEGLFGKAQRRHIIYVVK